MIKSTVIISFCVVVLYSVIRLSEAQSVNTGTSNVATTNTPKTERKLSRYEEIAVELYKSLGIVMAQEMGLKIENETDVYIAKELLPTRKEWESAVNTIASSKSSKNASGGPKLSDGAKTTNDTIVKTKEDIKIQTTKDTILKIKEDIKIQTTNDTILKIKEDIKIQTTNDTILKIEDTKPALYNQSVQLPTITEDNVIITKEYELVNDTEIIYVRGEVNQLQEDFKNLKTNLSIVSKKMKELGSEYSKEVTNSIGTFFKMNESMKLGFGNQRDVLNFVTSIFSLSNKIDEMNRVVSAKLNSMDNDVKQIKEIISVLNKTLSISC